MPVEIRVEPDLAALAAAGAEILIQSAHAAIADHGRFSISLSGGSTPRSLYALLAQPSYLSRINWKRVDIFWGDERCVPRDHPDSDYGMARAALLDHLPQDVLPSIHRLEGELDPFEAAGRYEKVLKSYFGLNPKISFDLLLLGMGEDGHTASLFPFTQPVRETVRWVVAHYVPKLSAYRLTLTPPILNKSRTILFLAAGANKASVLARVLSTERNPDELPSQAIHPETGSLIWLVDRAAASELPPR